MNRKEKQRDRWTDGQKFRQKQVSVRKMEKQKKRKTVRETEMDRKK